jgi:hypothetical protein
MDVKLKNAKKRAWDAFSRYIRLRDALKTTSTKTHLKCISCEKVYPAFGKPCAQAGHLIPGRGNAVLIDERFVNGQCYNCNVNLKGNWVPYRRKMVEWYGEEAVKEVEDHRKDTVQRKVYEWLEIEKEYKEKYNKLNEI